MNQKVMIRKLYDCIKKCVSKCDDIEKCQEISLLIAKLKMLLMKIN